MQVIRLMIYANDNLRYIPVCMKLNYSSTPMQEKLLTNKSDDELIICTVCPYMSGLSNCEIRSHEELLIYSIFTCISYIMPSHIMHSYSCYPFTPFAYAFSASVIS